MAKGTRRATALLAASLLVVSTLGAAYGAHHCPHHDAGSAAGHESASGHEHDASPASEAHGPCTCMGECQAGAAPSVPAPAVGSDLPAPPAAPHAFRSAPSVPRASIVPFSLPWGNAPPTL
jgi:hypothetical protein